MKRDNASTFTLLLALIAVNVEMDIFLPSLPQMKDHFQVDEGTVEWVLSINLIGLCLSGFFSGWLSDTYGRKKVIFSGLLLFVSGSIGCIFAESFTTFLAFRLLQGIGCGPPATVSFAAVCDIYSDTKATKIISLFNGVITGTTVGAPLLGVFLGNIWSWKANFIFISIFAVMAFILFFAFFKESLAEPLRRKLNCADFMDSLSPLLCNGRFWSTSLVAILMYASLIVFLANFSLLAIDHWHVSRNLYGWLQATVMVSFVMGSFLCSYLLKFVESQKLINWGKVLIVIGSVLLIAAVNIYTKIWLITTSIACFNAGAAFLIAIFATRSIQLFEKAKGMVSSFIGSLRMLISAMFIFLSSLLFNGTFHPLGWMIFCATLCALILIRQAAQFPKIELSAEIEK